MVSEKPSAWAKTESARILSQPWPTGEHGDYLIAHALDAAEQRGFDRAVNETAIASIQKSVASERAAIVAWLRAEAERCASACSRGSHDAGIGMVVLRTRADFIERGEHHPKEGA